MVFQFFLLKTEQGGMEEDLKSRLHALEISIEKLICSDFLNHVFVF